MQQAIAAKAKHPKGLYVLFFTEMWERFGFYLMIGIFFLYLTDTVGHGGRGLDNAAAVSIVGSYVALIYLTPFIGGLVADRILGYTKSIFLGGALLALGYFLIAFNGSDGVMYAGLFSAIIGNGFFKPEREHRQHRVGLLQRVVAGNAFGTTGRRYVHRQRRGWQHV